MWQFSCKKINLKSHLQSGSHFVSASMSCKVHSTDSLVTDSLDHPKVNKISVSVSVHFSALSGNSMYWTDNKPHHTQHENTPQIYHENIYFIYPSKAYTWFDKWKWGSNKVHCLSLSTKLHYTDSAQCHYQWRTSASKSLTAHGLKLALHLISIISSKRLSDREHLSGLNILPATLNKRSTGADEAGMARYFTAIFARAEKRCWLVSQ